MTVTNIPPNQDSGAENERLRFALQAASIGTWDLNLRTKVAWWDQRTKELYGFAGTDTLDFESDRQLMKYVHPQDQQRVQQAMQWAMDPRSGGQYEIEFRIIRLDEAQVRWLQAKGQAFFDDQGIAYRFSGTAQDITQQVFTRQLAEEGQEGLRMAIELAQLGTWQFDLTTNHIEYSARLRAWHGIEADESITVERAFRLVRLSDWPRVQASMRQAIAVGSDGYYDVEYRVTDPSGVERILHSQGKAYVNQLGQTYKISGTVQDVTQQRQAQLALEQLVVQRTQQLETSIEDLRRSNENLQQFAYIASHDLQEPLRKVQQFGDLLQNQYGDLLGDGSTYLVRMQAAANRMSTLIKDLLTYARIATHQELSDFVSLDVVVQTVLLDLEVIIHETGAIVEIGPLPIVQGDQSQLEQLVQNLLSNALKFRVANRTPIIQIRAYNVVADQLPESVKPARKADVYCQMEIVDNGIGFEEKYLDRMFQIFQRLHGKSQYSGTGIGLAICEKIVLTHGGTITARSKPNEGSVFSVFLPLPAN